MVLDPLLDPLEQVHARHPILASKPKRDSQRRRVYAADRRVGFGRRFATIDEAQLFLEEVICSRWWHLQVARSNYLDQTLDFDYPETVRLQLKRRGKSSSGNWMTATIRLVSKHLCVRILLHELAHVVTPIQHLAHGREFCRNYLQIVRRVEGDEVWRALKQAFGEERVKWVHGDDTQ